MATITFPTLSLPPLDDSMEVSHSPAAHTLDDDDDINIDIDFDGYYNNHEGLQANDDEHMLEDGEPVRPPTATDEMMGDDEHVNVATTHEEVMQDSDESAQLDLADEELIDYDDDDDYQYQGLGAVADPIIAPVEPAVQDFVPNTNSVSDALAKTVEEADEEIPRLPEAEVNAPEVLLEENITSAPEDVTHIDSVALAAEDTVQQAEQQEASVGSEQAGVDDPGADGKPELHTDESKALTSVEEGENDDVATHTVEDEAASFETLSRKLPPQLPANLDTTTRLASEGPPTPTDTGLHPMMVRYGHIDMPLFKSSKQPDGLLKDDNLANVSLSDLIRSCRERLPKKTGEAVSDEHDLVLGFNPMGLVLVEGSPSASDTSLEDVLDVYMLLHRNDGKDDVPPLSMTLTAQLKFSCHLNMFKRAALEGRGMSSYAIPKVEDFYDEEAEQEGPFHHSHDDEQAQADEVDNESGATVSVQGHAQDFAEDASVGEPAAEHQHDEAIDAYAQEGDFPEGQEYNEEIDYEEYDEQAEYPDPEDDPATGTPAAPDHDQSHAKTGGEVDTAALDSAASSATVRGDHSNDATDAGIDEIPNDLAPLSAEHDPETEAHRAGPLADADFDGAYEAEQHDSREEDPEVHEDDDELDLNLDFDEPFGAEPDYPDLEEDEQQHDEVGVEPNQHEEYHDDHADLLEDGDHGELQPQDDDDQFHTAFDLVDGEDPEHGPGHGAPSDAHIQFADTVNHEEDNLVFDDDEEADASKDEPIEASASSPHGKRSFEQHTDDDVFGFDEEPETKKARSG